MSLWQICGVHSAISSQTQNSPLIVWGPFPSRLLACCGSPVIRQWKKFKEFVSDHRIYEAMQEFFMNGRKQRNSSETVGNLLFFLFCLFSFGTTHGKKVDREFWKVFSSALPPLPQKYRAKLLLILKGTETNAEHFLIVAEEVFSVFRNVNVQFNRILNNSFLKFTLCCYKRVFCLRLKQCFYAKGARLVLPTGCEFIAKAHTMFVTIFFAGSASLLLSIASITRSQTVFKQHFSTCNLWSICEPRNI